jgi:hypothetical protein
MPFYNTNDREMMKKWVDFLEIKFHSRKDIEWHCMQFEFNWNQIQLRKDELQMDIEGIENHLKNKAPS